MIRGLAISTKREKIPTQKLLIDLWQAVSGTLKA
jgi:hypothetical protein